jgi:hypothetical protein
MEQLFNIYSTTLSSSYTAGSGIIHVASGGGLPSGGQFALTVLDQTTLAIKVIFRGSFLGGTAIAVTAEGSDANANSGDIVVGSMMTVRSLVQILEDWLGYGPTANLPSATGRKLGQRFKVNDGNFEYVLDDGTLSSPASGSPLWVPYYRGVRTAIPDNSTFSWINQSSASVAVQTDGSILLTGTANAGSNIQARVFSAPGGSYKYKFIITPYLPLFNFAECGICATDGTKFSALVLNFVSSATGLIVIGDHWNTTSSFAANVGSQKACTFPLVMGIGDDGVNRTLYIYPDGYTEEIFFQETRTTFLTATQLGFFYNDNQANKGGGIILNGLERVI